MSECEPFLIHVLWEEPAQPVNRNRNEKQLFFSRIERDLSQYLR